MQINVFKVHFLMDLFGNYSADNVNNNHSHRYIDLPW